MAKVQGLGIGRVCKDMDLSESDFRRWLSQFKAQQQGQSGIGKLLTAKHQRIRQRETDERRREAMLRY